MNDILTSGKGLPEVSARSDGIRTVQIHYFALALLLATILIVFAQTFGSMLNTWLNSATFLHGFLVFPISAYLIWLKRRELRHLRPAGCWPGVAGLLILSLIWWFADALSIQVVMQLAVTAMISVAVITVMGRRYAGRIAFPLGYLFFAVPIGEALVPYLIDYTAAFTVRALDITGIPVFRDGRYFSIPVGNFEVARACSGIRYLLAALALGSLFANINFKSNKKRALFVLFSIVMPIVANGLRAYGIVLLAQFVSLEFATGVDHIIFGWIFFGVVVSLMFVIGSRFSDRDPEETGTSPSEETFSDQYSASTGQPLTTIALLGVSAVCVAAGPALAVSNAQQASAPHSVISGLPSDLLGWSGIASLDSDWRPEFHGATYEAFGRYTKGDSILDAAIVQYRGGQRQGAELATSKNSVVNTDIWRIGNLQSVIVRLSDGSDVRINEAIVHSRVTMRAVWFWYDIDGEHAASNMQVKLLEARSLIMGNQPLSSAIVISTDASVDVETSRNLMQEFLRVAYQPMRECISGRVDDDGCSLDPHRSGAH